MKLVLNSPEGPLERLNPLKVLVVLSTNGKNRKCEYVYYYYRMVHIYCAISTNHQTYNYMCNVHIAHIHRIKTSISIPISWHNISKNIFAGTNTEKCDLLFFFCNFFDRNTLKRKKSKLYKI